MKTNKYENKQIRKQMRTLVPFALMFVAVSFSSCNSSSENETDEEDSAVVMEEPAAVVAVPYDDNDQYLITDDDMITEDNHVDPVKKRYEDMKVTAASNNLLYEDGKKIWYCPWTSESESGYSNRLIIYDSETDRERVVSLNKTELDDEYININDIASSNGILTIIMTEQTNSNGWVIATDVWQYNCKTGSWKALAKGCSGAKFINNETAVQINNAECLNPEAFTYEQKYRNHYKTIRL